MTNDLLNATPAQCADDSSQPSFSANDFTRIGWTYLDCLAADAKSAGKSVMYSDDSGFVAVQCEDGEP